jgi:hypothetical protein
VHKAAHDNRGEPNKNIGDAFLIVWRPAKMPDGSLTSRTKIVDGALRLTHINRYTALT